MAIELAEIMQRRMETEKEDGVITISNQSGNLLTEKKERKESYTATEESISESFGPQTTLIPSRSWLVHHGIAH